MIQQHTSLNTRKKIDKLMAKGNFKAAASLLQKLCHSTPGNAEVHYMLGICLGRLGRWSDAILFLQKGIDLRPDIAQLHFAHGIAQQELKQFGPATKSFLRALELDKNLIGAHIYLAKTYLIQQDFSLSQKHYQLALKLNPAMAEAYYGLGCIEHETGHSERAIEFLEKALKYQPNSVDTLRMLGSLFEKEGDIDKSAAYYEKALRINPNSVQAAAGLALIHEFNGEMSKAVDLIEPLLKKHDCNPALGVAYAKLCKHMNRCEEAVDYIERTLTSPNITSNRIRKNLHLTVADVLDKLKQYDTAFKHFKVGNDIAATQTYDIVKHTDMIDNIIRIYNKELFIRLPRSTHNDSRPVFIIGMPRSGTSLTEQILAAHPDVHAAGELKILDRIVNQTPHKTKDAKCYHDQVPFLDQHDLDNMSDRYLKHLDSLSSNAKRITDKMPHNFYHLGIIQLLFPGARIIHLTRNPLDTCLSIYLQNFSHGHFYANNLFNIGTHYYQYQRLMDHWKEVIKPPLIEISYEQLVNDQITVTQQLLEFCDLEWNDNCLQFYKHNRNVFTSSYNQIRQPLYNKSIGRWRNYEQYLDELKKGLQLGH